ncbi:DUF3298/DUF4163 domain-containing protein [Candidatus Aerophobetes bacterium]|uniref:DUF3298/DUF4163 domain-containing protein n=1 Tax=Aerophobetes bacterium TaxID=2030807 RepID=A0A523W9W0_UNCAE|nr:MAG: DUF3298/DUF4163 domain-containing protein [Candidatus Aerophobetes bacterium]
MKTKKLLAVSMGAIWLLSMVGLLASEASANEARASSLPVNIESIRESDSFFYVQAEYPEFLAVSDDFSHEIAALISDKISGFKKESVDNWKARLDTVPAGKPVPENPERPFPFIASWESAQLNNQYLSLVIKIYYFSGGAHGSEEIHTFNYDMLQKKKIGIEDFLDSSQEALERISKISAEDITSQLKSTGWKEDDTLKEMINQGTAPTFENFKNFNFDPQGLTIYFGKYQVAPGAVGSLTIRITKALLEQNLLQSDYLK